MAGGVAMLTGLPACSPQGDRMMDRLQEADRRVVFTDPSESTEQVRLLHEWDGRYARPRLVNEGTRPARIREVILASYAHGLPSDSELYGEGFTMLSQTGGTLAEPADIGFFTDRDHYRIPEPPDATTVYSLLMLTPPSGSHHLWAFTSCHRFSGAFRLREGHLDIVVDTENLVLEPGQSWSLEELVYDHGDDRNAMLDRLAERINRQHPPRRGHAIPTGWCSWYCFGPDVTAQQIRDQIPVIKQEFPGLRFVQIDDGYQPEMGDWLITQPDFGEEFDVLCRAIHAEGLGVGIWVAPFVAGEDSQLFREHPEWFIRDEQGQPLRSDRVSFGGWRLAPWYALDGTHPEAQAFLEGLFRELRERYKGTYFKLDANYWGTLHGGQLHDPNATRIEAYRRGMEAILRGAGDSFILGCNHSMWPSLGLIDGSRCSMDIVASGDDMLKASRECFYRDWQHGTLWFNDPDVILLSGDVTEQDRRFRSTVLYATGGMMIAGDDLAAMKPSEKRMLAKLIPPTGVAARFEDTNFNIGRVELPQGRKALCLFNWSDGPLDISVELRGRYRITDVWSEEDLGMHTDRVTIEAMPPRSARLLFCEPQ